MRRTPPIGLLMLLLLLVAGHALPVDATDQAPESVPSVQSRWGWSAGTPGAGLAEALAPIDPVTVALPAEIVREVKGDTALLYFSPTCPHCRHAMPELMALRRLQPDLGFLGIATSSTTQAALDEFIATFGVDFPVQIDGAKGFAWATGARGTPSLILVRPAPPGSRPTSGEAPAEGTKVVTVLEAWMPYTRGLAPVIAMRRNAMGRTVDGQVLPPDAYRDFKGYQGSRACAACHGDEATSWALSHHAGAYLSLYQKERHEDLACVGCHVVGFEGGTDGSPPVFPGAGGFALSDHSSPLADVGCEACHGPAGPHDGQPAATPAGGDAMAACQGCHDAKHSIAFAVEKGMPFIDHYLSVGMDEDALRARLDALASGTADRPLLAFPSGPTVGAETCRECHKAEHKGWKDQHGRAMDTLRDEDHGDQDRPECVSCHATATRYGGLGRGTELSDYRLDEGVGCEACHGPGGAHLADPRTETIVHLGESCPECVLEGICTSCHVPDWDPTWQLEPRLKALPYDDAKAP